MPNGEQPVLPIPDLGGVFGGIGPGGSDFPGTGPEPGAIGGIASSPVPGAPGLTLGQLFSNEQLLAGFDFFAPNFGLPIASALDAFRMGPLPAPMGTLPGTPGPPRRTPTRSRAGTRADTNIITLVQLLALLAQRFFGRGRTRRAPRPQFNINLGGNVPNIPTLVAGPGIPGSVTFPGTGLPGNGNGGFGDLIGSVLGSLPGILGPIFSPPTAMPGGAPLLPSLPSLPSIGGIMPDIPFIDVVPQGATCITPRQSQVRRLPSRVDVPTMDSSGNVRFTTFKNMGRPVLWTGDFAAAKRVKKVASRARRSGGR